MGGRIATIIFLAVVIIQVVASLLAKASKNQQKRRTQEQAAQRRQAASGQVQARPGRPTGQPTVSAQAGSTGGGRSLNDLAARRRTQLEQLRQRRKGTAAARTQQYPTGQPAQKPSAPSQLTPAPPASGVDHMSRLAKAEQRAEARRQSLERRLREKQERLQREARRREAARRASREQAPRRKPASVPQKTVVEAVEPTLPRDAYALPGDERSRIARALHRQFRSRASLRELLVAKELLDPPVGVRPIQF